MEINCYRCGSNRVIPTGKEKEFDFSDTKYIEYICDKCGYIFWIIEDNKDEDT